MTKKELASACTNVALAWAFVVFGGVDNRDFLPIIPISKKRSIRIGFRNFKVIAKWRGREAVLGKMHIGEPDYERNLTMTGVRFEINQTKMKRFCDRVLGAASNRR